MGVRGGGQGQGGEQRQEEQANLWTDKPPPDPTAGRLSPSHGKLCKKGICSGMSRLVKGEEERKKRELERVVVGEVGFVRLLAL